MIIEISLGLFILVVVYLLMNARIAFCVGDRVYGQGLNSIQARLHQRRKEAKRIDKLNAMSYEEKKTHLETHPSDFRLLKNPPQELALIAIREDASMINFVTDLDLVTKILEMHPEKILDKNFRRKFSINSWNQFRYWRVAITTDGSLLQYCPIKEQSIGLCLMAVKQNRAALDFIHSYATKQSVIRILDQESEINSK